MCRSEVLCITQANYAKNNAGHTSKEEGYQEPHAESPVFRLIEWMPRNNGEPPCDAKDQVERQEDEETN